MSVIEIVVIVVACLAVIGVIAYFIYKKVVKKEPIGDCGCCAQQAKNLVKQYHKKYGKKNDNTQEVHCCCCENKEQLEDTNSDIQANR